MTIPYPQILEEKLPQNRGLRAAVDATTTDFEAWLKDSKLPFFRDYTDHGPEHLTQVLTTACGLMSEQSIALLTASDATVLILATLLHDSAMHISEAGFWELIKGRAANNRVPEFDRVSWPDLWQNFLFSAKRWDEDKVLKVLGSPPPYAHIPSVRDPFREYADLSNFDRALIGEFVRLHHARMAHEFAVFGVPGPAGEPISLSKLIAKELADLSGLVARSHGMEVRSCLDYLSSRYHKREFKEVHAVFLMVLLRVADYLQIQPNRAPSIAFRYRHIPSKTSQLEWKAHQAIRNITQTHDDPESVEIQASPQDVHTFLRIQEWLTGIQRELDASWAVLGEVYGSNRTLGRLGLIIRRVRTNLDDRERFSEEVSYVPTRVEFEVQRPDLLKLLIRPLYGDKPEVGIRELMQNAVDAVREFWALEERHPELQSVRRVSQDADVVIWLDDPDETGSAWLTVSDRGVGMTPEVIHNYFLRAGASYRSSDAWQREFEIDSQASTENPVVRSRVLRSGRFGVGVLAAFLLGEEFEVATRYALSPTGIRFNTRLDLEPIELLRDTTLPVGTTLRMRVSPQTLERLRRDEDSRWDWFCFDRPKVVRVFGRKRQLLTQKHAIAASLFASPSQWRKVDFPGYSGIYWSYGDAPGLNCNGIFVKNFHSNQNHFPQRIVTDTEVRIARPNITVLDPDGRFPLNLHRDDLEAESDPFDDRTWKEILKDVLGYLLVNTPRMLEPMRLFALEPHPGLSFGRRYWHREHPHPWFFTRHGLGVADPSLVEALAPERLLLLAADDRDMWTFAPDVGRDYYDAVFGFCCGRARRALVKFINDQLTAFDSGWRGYDGRSVSGVRVITTTKYAVDLLESKSFYKQMTTKDYSGEKQHLKEIREKLQFERRSTEWSMLATSGCPETLVNFGTTSLKPPKHVQETVEANKRPREKRSFAFDYDDEREQREEKHPCVLEVFLSKAQPKVSRKQGTALDAPPARGAFEGLWQEIICRPVIPYKPEERRRKLRSAFETLDYFVKVHEAIKHQYQKV